MKNTLENCKLNNVYLFIGLLLLVGSGVWPQITSSLWIDEAGTWWIVKDTLSEAIDRALWWSATSPLYYIIIWGWATVFGTGEVSLRLPSLFLTLGTAILLYKFALNWLDKEGALLSAIIYLCNFSVSFSMIDARPYALGLFFLSSAWLSLISWIKTRKVLYGFFFVLCSAYTIWAHYMFFLGLIPIAFYFFELGLKRAIISVFSILLLLLPLLPQLKAVFLIRNELSFMPQPSISQLFYSIFPIEIIFLFFWLLIIIIIQLPKYRYRIKKVYKCYRPKVLILPLMVLSTLPPITLFILGKIDGNSIFVSRYMISKELGLAVMAAWVVRGVSHRPYRLLCIFSLFLLLLSYNILTKTSHGFEDWRGSSEWVNSEIEINPKTSIIIISGFIESMQTKYLNDPLREDILYAPQKKYPISCSMYKFPRLPNDEAERRLLQDLLPETNNQEQILVLGPPASKCYKNWFEEYLKKESFKLKVEKKFGEVYGLLFSRNPY
jgi:hypothetical protein